MRVGNESSLDLGRADLPPEEAAEGGGGGGGGALPSLAAERDRPVREMRMGREGGGRERGTYGGRWREGNGVEDETRRNETWRLSGDWNTE